MGRVNIDKKMQAAELFAEGLGYKAVATRLGVSKDTAKTWLYAYRAMGEEGLSRRHASADFTVEQKLEAVLDRTERGRGAVEVIAERGIPSKAMLRRWVLAYEERGEEGLRPGRRGRPPKERPEAQG